MSIRSEADVGWRALALTALLLPSQASFSRAVFAAAAPGVPADHARLLNRTLLSVGNDTYTAWDAAALLCAWNDVAMAKADAKDTRRILFLALVWSESRKLNLFVPQDKELDAASQALRSKIKACSPPSAGPELAAFFSDLTAARLRFYVDVALRAKAFERVRGGLDRNAALLSQTWFWHSTGEGEP